MTNNKIKKIFVKMKGKEEPEKIIKKPEKEKKCRTDKGK
jgi:hypothetical protein